MGKYAQITLITLLMISTPAFGQGKKAQYVPGEVIVKLKDGNSENENYAFMGKAQHQKGMALKRSFKKMRMYHYRAKPGKSVEDTIAELKNDPSVEYAEPNYIYTKKDLNGFEQLFSADEIESLAGSGDYMATNANIQATDTWSSLSVPSVKPIVAVIDTGLDINHAVFTGSNALWVNSGEIPGNGKDDDGNGFKDDVNGWNFVSNNGNMIDDDGHGTHVSGIVLGVGQDIFSAPYDESKIEIMPLKFLDGTGSGSTSDAISAIYYAVNNGASVINNSWGGPGYSSALHEALAFAYNQGVAIVAAAGNSNSNNDYNPMYPASYNIPSSMSIAATTDLDMLASFSNFGSSSVHLGSPGVFVLSTVPGGGYGTASGTSMAAPFISGLAALMLIEAPGMLGYQIKQGIFSEADHVYDLDNKVKTESRVNVSNSVNYAKTAVVSNTQPDYNYSISDRNLASSLAGGGCGMVTKMYNDMTKGGRGGPGTGAPGTWYVIIILGLLSIPLLFVQYMRSQLPESRRKHKRFKIDSDVRINVGGKQLVGNVTSISQGGVQVCTNELLDDGSVIAMTITSPDGKEQIQVDGHIVWSEAKKAYGVQFAEQNSQLKHTIKSWTKLLKAS